jgi:hypothetical protein
MKTRQCPRSAVTSRGIVASRACTESFPRTILIQLIQGVCHTAPDRRTSKHRWDTFPSRFSDEALSEGAAERVYG